MSLYSFSPTRPCFRLCTIDGIIRCFLISYHLLPKLQVTLVNSDIHYSFIPSPPPKIPQTHISKAKNIINIHYQFQIIHSLLTTPNLLHQICFFQSSALRPSNLNPTLRALDIVQAYDEVTEPRSTSWLLDKMGRKDQEFPVMWEL